MISRHPTQLDKGFSVVPRVRVALGRVTMLEMKYSWEGKEGVVPELSMELSMDPSLEKLFFAGVYQHSSGERRVVIDNVAVDMNASPQSRIASSTDSMLASGEWQRLFTMFQVSVPPGTMGSIEDENTSTHVFEYSSRP